MSGDQEVEKEIAQVIRQADYECEMAESVQMPLASWAEHQARAVLASPIVVGWRMDSEVLAKVRDVTNETPPFNRPEPSPRERTNRYDRIVLLMGES